MLLEAYLVLISFIFVSLYFYYLSLKEYYKLKQRKKGNKTIVFLPQLHFIRQNDPHPLTSSSTIKGHKITFKYTLT